MLTIFVSVVEDATWKQIAQKNYELDERNRILVADNDRLKRNNDVLGMFAFSMFTVHVACLS